MRAMRRGTYCRFKLFVAIVVLMIDLKELCANATSEANANATFGGVAWGRDRDLFAPALSINALIS